MASLPTPIRATLGLLATALDAVQELVDHAPEIPMEAVGNSMQLSLRLQQQYVALLTRGDEFLASLRGAPEEPPAWATFDEPPPESPVELTDVGLADVGLVDVGLVSADPAGAEVADDACVVDDLPEAEIQDGPRHAGQGDPLLAAATRSRPTPAAAAKSAAKKAPAKKAPAKQVAAKKAPAKQVAKKADRVEAVPVKKAPAARAKKAAPVRRIAKAAAPAAPALDSAGPILSAPTVPAKRGRPAKKAGARKAAAPQLDASLTAGTTSARLQSAFDLADTPADVGTDGTGALSAAMSAEHTAAARNATDNVTTGNNATESGVPTSATE